MLPSSSVPAGARYHNALESYRLAVERLVNAEHLVEQAKGALIKANGDLAQAVEGLMSWAVVKPDGK